LTTLAPDPLEPGGIAGYGRRLRAGTTTAEAATAAYLERIAALDPKLGAYQHVAAEPALANARALDQLLAAGTDLGPLMGVPVAIKDIFAVGGMPVTAGSRLEVADLIGPEGSFVQALRRAGCVILGKVKTVEFALGAVGISTPQGTPWNPWDAATQRIPGGSSSGPAVAVAASLCAFAIGSDTGGSVRLPACFCGTFGHKTSVGLWPTDGVFPLSAGLDTIGPLTASAADAALIFAALTGAPPPRPAPAASLRLGRPRRYFFDHLDDAVAERTGWALARLAEAGATLEPLDLPEAPEREGYFPVVLPAELIATLGRERFAQGRAAMDPVVGARGDRGLEVRAADHLRLERRRRQLCRSAAERLAGFAGIVAPTAAILPPPVAEFADPAAGLKLALAITQNSQPGNLLDLCGTSTPIQGADAPLPIGLQILCPPHHDARALAIALTLEELFGRPPKPDLAGFGLSP
jgi:aspartyl-tRNA(Asn)/glutamyl-tRNA(Gln) amidotransferase subunit A